MEGRYDAVRGHRTGSNKSPPLSVPVSPSPVSREASRDCVALDMWLHTRYQESKLISGNIRYTRFIPGIYFGVGLGRLGWVNFFTFLIRGDEILYSVCCW